MIRQIILTPNCIYKKQSQLFFLLGDSLLRIEVFYTPFEIITKLYHILTVDGMRQALQPQITIRKKERESTTSSQKCTHISSKSAIHEDIGFRHLFARPFHLAKLDEGRRHRLFSLLGVSIVETNP